MTLQDTTAPICPPEEFVAAFVAPPPTAVVPDGAGVMLAELTLVVIVLLPPFDVTVPLLETTVPPFVVQALSGQYPWLQANEQRPR